MSITPDYSQPVKGTPTPTLTVASCITWLDLEIESLQTQYATEDHETVALVLKGTWLYLEVMKAKLMDHTLQLLDQHHGQ